MFIVLPELGATIVKFFKSIWFKLKNISAIRRNLIVSSTIIFAIGAGLNFFSLTRLTKVNNVTEDLAQHWLPLAGKSGEIAANVSLLRALQLELLSGKDTDKTKTKAEKATQNIIVYSRVVENLVTSDKEISAYGDFESAWKDFKNWNEKISGAVGKKEEIEKLLTDSHPSFEKISDTLLALSNVSYDGSLAARKTADELVSFSKILIYCGIAFGFLLSIFTIIVVGKKVAQFIGRIARDLAESIETTVNTSFDLVNISKSLSADTEKQASAAVEIVSTLHEVSSMVASSAENAKESAKIAERSLSVVKEGKVAIDQMGVSMTDMEKANEDVIKQIMLNNEKIAEISESIKTIAGKTKIIDDIVFQTKLLSFNASVEAARAGENGKGFSVVAEEVGNLAQMSKSAAAEITVLVNTSVDRVDAILMETRSFVEGLSRDSRERMEAGKASVSDCENLFNTVLSDFEAVKSQVAQVANASAEQTQGVDNIVKAVAGLEMTNQATSKTAGEALEFAQILATQADSLKISVEKLDNSGNKSKPNANVIPISSGKSHQKAS